MVALFPEDLQLRPRHQALLAGSEAVLVIPLLTSGARTKVKMPKKPTHDEIKLWSESVDKLLSHKAGQVAFRNFLTKEYSEENIDFWLACEDYKKIKCPTKLACEAKKIYTKFIKVEAPEEINIDFTTRENIAKSINEPTPSSFDLAQKLIYSLMAKDCYPRFLRSNNYLELVTNAEKSQQK
ncbi:regulator of G-protein signaling 21-like [Chiloscyllium punctatum]|uniref:regulator of G-protein signaling 21-like n=1 Tax=Chiloscyllium punctatum TaxID=137246 RepID=UPI003B642184